MNKKTPFFTASVASILYFVVLTLLTYFLGNKIDLLGTLAGAVGFWIVIFLVHHFLNRRYAL